MDQLSSSDVAFISEESMDALEAQKDRVYVAPALNILYSSWLVAQKAECKTPRMFDLVHTTPNFTRFCSRFQEVRRTKI